MTDVAIYQPGELAAAPPPAGPLDGWIAVADQVVRLAQTICTSPFVPDGLRGSVPATAAAILAGRELGIPPMTSLANVHVIKGKTGISALLMRALIQAQGHDWEDVEVNDTRVVIRGRRKGETEWTTAMFTADQARKAHIDLGGYPQDKLYARATSRLARRKFADVIAGMPYSAEELEDGDDGEAGTVAEAAPVANGTAPKAPARTARRARTASAAPATEPATQAPAGPQRAAEPPQPPLPGEDDERPADDAPDGTDYDTHGTATRGQLTAIWTVLSTVYGFTSDEKPQARKVCEHIIERQLIGGTTGNLSCNEAKTVLDTLAALQTVAEGNEVSPREQLIALLAGSEASGA